VTLQQYLLDLRNDIATLVLQIVRSDSTVEFYHPVLATTRMKFRLQ
jgi:hypothetical protein